MARWHLITGEYPPKLGGVSDYTRQVARALAAAGDEVHVWAPPAPVPSPVDTGVCVHHLPNHFGLRTLTYLDAALDRQPRPFRLLVQYVPQMYGRKGMNLPFCLWLHSRRREPIWVMFHEVAVPWDWGQSVRRNGLAVVTRLMAFLVARSAQQVFISIPGWKNRLRFLAPAQKGITWLPIPSNLPTEIPPNEVAAVRARLALGPSHRVIGNFGTFGEEIAAILAEAFPRLLEADARRVALLVGRGARCFRSRLLDHHPQLGDRLHAAEGLPPEQAAAHLAACDVLLQPYPDGVSSRRTSLMAGLALGRPIVTNAGRLTEPLWAKTQAVWLVHRFQAAPLINAVQALLADSQRQARLAAQAGVEYRNRFTIDRTIQTLRTQAESPPQGRSRS